MRRCAASVVYLQDVFAPGEIAPHEVATVDAEVVDINTIAAWILSAASLAYSAITCTWTILSL
jgi:hypothetical protein